MAFDGCWVKTSFTAVAGLMITPVRVPVFPLPSVAVRLIVCAVVSLVDMTNDPAVRVFALSPYTPSPLPSKCTLPDPLIVTAVLLSVETV